MQKYPTIREPILLLYKEQIKTIPVTKKLGIQTKRPMCYNFYFGILDEKKDVMFP
jgi:hypothetical protein